MYSVSSLHITFELWCSILCLIAVLCTVFAGMEKAKRRFFIGMQLATAVLLLSDAVAWGFRGVPGSMAYYGVRISNFLVFFTSDLLLFLFHGYMCCCFFPSRREQKGELPKRLKFVYIIALAGMALVVISQFTGLYYRFNENNEYYRSPAFPLSVLVCMAGLAADFSLTIQYRRNVERVIFVSTMSYIILPVIASMAALFYYGISFVNISIAISVLYMFVAAMIEQGRELAQIRIEVMLSQMNPHFVYNTLNSIAYLCHENPELASETVAEFSEFLRGNVDSLTSASLIPFERELKHTQNYLAIEKKRFQDILRVEWEIEEDSFMLPALTLQPIVENAVKHGVTKKAGGGTVRIHAYKDERAFYICVEDDGVGFDIAETERKSGREHTGIPNVRSRLKSVCKGTLSVEGISGKGTVATIRIPIAGIR